MPETLLVIVVGCVLFAAALLVIGRWRRRPGVTCRRHVVINRALFENVKSDIKPGDLLLFSNYRYNFVTRTFGSPMFAHTGIVIERGGQLCSYEMVENDYTLLGRDPTKNILITPLEDRIINYPGNVFIASLKTPLSSTQLSALNAFVVSRKYTFTKRW